MTRQINLFAQQAPEPGFSARRVLIGLGIIVSGFVVYGVIGLMQSTTMNATIARNEAQIAAQKQALQQLTEKLGERPKPEAVMAEIAALKVLENESQEIIKIFDAPTVSGYTGHLAALAEVTEHDVWITGLTIGSDGKSVTLRGHALRKESVLRYAQRTGERLSGSGVQFKAVEMTPDAPVSVGAEAPLSSVTFKLF